MAFVADASATLPWCFEDEAAPWTEALLDRLGAGETAYVPAHWPVEVANALLSAYRRQRIEITQAEQFLSKLSSLSIEVQPPLSLEQSKAVFILCLQHGLTFYDGAYLELAQRLGQPIATSDKALLKAAPQARVATIP
jgi:predicted nucleic acid-binding protein